MSLIISVLSFIVFVGFISDMLYCIYESKPIRFKDILYSIGMFIIFIVSFIDYFKTR